MGSGLSEYGGPPNDLSDEEKIDIWILNAELETEKGNHNSSRAILRKAVDRFPDDKKVKDAFRNFDKRQVEKYKEDVAKQFGSRFT